MSLPSEDFFLELAKIQARYLTNLFLYSSTYDTLDFIYLFSSPSSTAASGT